MTYPTITEVKKLARDYNLIPISVNLLANFLKSLYDFYYIFL